MKTNRFIIPAVALLMFSSGFSASAAVSGRSESVSARVISVKGKVSYTSGGVSQTVEPGAEIPAGAEVQTGPESAVVLDLGPSGRVSLKPDSTLSLDRLKVQKSGSDTVVETQLEVRKGSILGNVKKLSSASKYEVKTEKGVAGIRGTSFHIFAIGIFRCSDGQIQVRLVNLTTRTVVDTFTVRPGQECNAAGDRPTVNALTSQIARELRSETREIVRIPLGKEGTILLVQGDLEQVRQKVREAVQSQNPADLALKARATTLRETLAQVLRGYHYADAIVSKISEVGYDAVLGGASFDGGCVAALVVFDFRREHPTASDAVISLVSSVAAKSYDFSVQKGLTGLQAFAGAERAGEYIEDHLGQISIENPEQRKQLLELAVNEAYGTAQMSQAGPAPGPREKFLSPTEE